MIEFEEWYRTTHPRLVTLVTVATGDREIGRDAADEALARAFERWDEVAVMDSPAAWTYTVALNVARRHVRRGSMERRLLRRSRPVEIPGPAGELWMVVEDLPVRQRETVLLRHVAQLTEAEIADVMGISRGAVSSSLRSAYRKLGVAVDMDEGRQRATPKAEGATP